MPVAVAVIAAVALVIHRCIAWAITTVSTARFRPVVTAMMPVMATRALIVNRLRLNVNRLRPHEHRARLVINRCWLHIHRLRLNVNRLGLIDRTHVTHIHHRTGCAHTH